MTDIIDRATGLSPGDALYDLRRQRPEFVAGAQACLTACLTPADAQDLSVPLRAALAAHMARLNGDAALAALYQPAQDQTVPPAILRHVNKITLTPRLATAADITALRDAGLDLPTLVALSELIALVNFQTRLTAGLRLLKTPTVTPAEVPIQRPRTLPQVTLKPLTWHAHIPPVEIAQASTAQLQAMQVTPSATKISPYVRTLAHDPDSYVARTILFNAIMYAEGGLPQDERELGALGASMINGCAYCAVVHARRQASLTGSAAVVSALFLGMPQSMPPRAQAIVRFGQSLSRTPPAATVQDLAALRAVGLGNAQIIDLIHAVAIFGWANRLMHVLGHATPPARNPQPRPLGTH
ncbi:MAG TPA: peroxidase-related enzyme [Paenirhodobacter sp.]